MMSAIIKIYFERGGDNMKQISFENIDLGGFWEAKQNTNRDVTMPVIYKQFYDSGRITAFACDWKPGDEKKPHYFWDSDIAKWIEGLAYSLNYSENDELVKINKQQRKESELAESYRTQKADLEERLGLILQR